MNPRRFFLLNIVAVVAIMLLDARLPAGMVVGILGCVPILLCSMVNDRRAVWWIGGVAVVGFSLALLFGAPPVSPPSVWVPNSVIAFLSLFASTAVALLLQRRRLDTVRSRDEAVAASDLNRLLMSLLAHDLRSPLSLANQGFEYVEESATEGHEIDTGLLADIRARLQRSMRAIEVVLSLARDDVQRAETADMGEGAAEPVALQAEIQAEIDAFEYEARVRNKQLRVELDGLAPDGYRVDIRVLRQVLAILLDNAVRYAVPGTIRVAASTGAFGLEVRVADEGPGLSAHQRDGKSAGGSGLGLELCRALAARAGGGLEVERDAPEGTTLLLRLPADQVGGAPTEDAAVGAVRHENSSSQRRVAGMHG